MDASTGSTFGEMLRSYRNSANLTQEELAARTGLTPQAIGLLERGERRRPHKYTVEKLAEVLGLTVQDLARFEAAARRSSVRRATAERSHGDLPVPTTTLVGREHETTSVARLLLREEVRLLTLTGPGGVGKTRLALEVAERSRDAFADGMVFVALAPLRDAALLPSVLAKTLGIKEVAGQPLQETLIQRLQNRQMLLVLDNFEHLLVAAPIVGELVGRCPQLTVLVTSRAPLHLSGEHQFPVPPLPLPDAASRSPAKVLEQSTPAMELFRQRAQSVMPNFELTTTNAATVALICRRLDGLPLAIELAAARVKLFHPRTLLARLDRRLHLLTGGARDLPERQQTLRDTVAWSYDLLDLGEQALFRRLAVFAGSFAMDALEDVCGSEEDEHVVSGVLERVASLVDNSLLVSLSESATFREDEEPRFAMLETIREYALERLTSSDEAEEAYRKHARYYVELGEAAKPEASNLFGVSKFVRLEREHDNLRAALGWALQNREAELGARLALSVCWFWIDSGYHSDLRWWIDTLVGLARAESLAGEALSASTKAYLIQVAGIFAMAQGHHDRAVALHEEGLDVYREMGDKKGESASLRELGFVAYEQGDYERAVRLQEQSLVLAREYGNTFDIAWSIRALADAVRGQGDLRRAQALLEEGLALARGTGNEWGIVRVLASLGSVAYEAGEYARARRLYEESLELGWRTSLNHPVLLCLEGLARVAVAQERPERAAWLYGAAATMREDRGWPLPPAKRADHERVVAAARKVLGEEAFETARVRGHNLPLEEVITDALGDSK